MGEEHQEEHQETKHMVSDEETHSVETGGDEGDQPESGDSNEGNESEPDNAED